MFYLTKDVLLDKYMYMVLPIIKNLLSNTCAKTFPFHDNTSSWFFSWCNFVLYMYEHAQRHFLIKEKSRHPIHFTINHKKMTKYEHVLPRLSNQYFCYLIIDMVYILLFYS